MHFQTKQNIIPIDDSSEVVLELHSPITRLTMQSDYALTFTQAITSELQSEMEFSNIPSTQHQKSKIPVHLFDENLIFTGDLINVESNADSYENQLSSAPGNITPELYKTSITKLDFGKDTIPTTTVTSPFYKIPTKELISLPTTSTKYSLDEQFGTYNSVVKVLIDNVVVFEYEYRYSASAYNEDFGSSGNPRLERFVQAYNDNDNSFKSKLEANADEWLFTIPQGTHTLKVEITITGRLSSSGGRDRIPRGTYPYTITYPATNYTFKSIGNYFDNSLLPTWTKPYSLPPIHNPNLYGDSNKAFNGTINYLNGTNYITNTPEKRTENTFCPAFSFQYILTKLFTILGYTLDQTWFNLPENKTLFWITFVCTDLQAPNLTTTFNIHNSEILYQDYLPNWTVREFLERFQNWKNIYFDFNQFTQTVKIIQRQAPFTAANKNIIDLTNISDDQYSQKPNKTPNYHVLYDITDSDDETLKNPLFSTRKSSDDIDLSIEEAKNYFAPMILSTDYTPTNTRTRGTSRPGLNSGGSTWDWSGNRNGGSTQTTTTPTTIRLGILTAYQKGKSPMYGLSTEDPKSRALYCQIQNQQILTENTFSTIETLFIDGAKGLFQKYWTQYLKAIANTTQIELQAQLNKIIVADFDFGILFYYQGSLYITDQISYSNQKELSKIKMLKIQS